MKLRSVGLVLGLIAVGVFAPWRVGGAEAAPKAPWGVTNSATPLCRGVTWILRTEVQPRRERINVLLVDLATPGLRFKLTPPSGHLHTVCQTTLQFLSQEHAQAAINSHFYLSEAKDKNQALLVGLAASDGVVYSGFVGQPVTAGRPDQSYAILPRAPALAIDRSNHAGIIHWRPGWPEGPHGDEAVELYTVVSGSAQILTDGRLTIPSYTGRPGGLNRLKGYSDSKSWYFQPKARTTIGLSRDRARMVILTVDKASGSQGMGVHEVAEMLRRDYGVWDAINLDGGRSTAMALRDPATGKGRLVNVPEEGGKGRAVGSNLALFSDPAPANP
jgi:Phosphodiester glycosidase